VRNEAHRSDVEQLGATKAIDPEGFEEHGPFDVVLELVGGPNMPGNLKALETQGRIAVIGIGGGPKAELSLVALMGKRARIHGSTLRARPLEQKADAARRVERHVLPLVERGSIAVPVAATFPLDRVEDAYDHFAAGGKLGKVVLLVP
jgi:NADPH:quinone reductase-like Zn-dependent oxidoreductase